METWEDIYNFCNNGWKGGLPETICGSGSTIKNTLPIINGLNKIIKKYNIKSIVDIGCGDFNWMKRVNLSNVNYTGYDWIFKSNVSIYNSNTIKFIKGNIIDINIEKSDLIICKDVMIHMNNDHALEILNNIKKSSSKYLLITTFETDTNMQRFIIKDFYYANSNFAPLNVELMPFNITNLLYKIKLDNTKYLNLYKLK